MKVVIKVGIGGLLLRVKVRNKGMGRCLIGVCGIIGVLIMGFLFGWLGEVKDKRG